MRDIYQNVTDQIIAELRAGVRPPARRCSETGGWQLTCGGARDGVAFLPGRRVVGDAMEETAHSLYDAAAGLGVPVFVFQEGSDPYVEQVFREISVITKGAYAKFGTGSARELAELLSAVATYAVGGATALADLRTDSARKLLGQLK